MDVKFRLRFWDQTKKQPQEGSLWLSSITLWRLLVVLALGETKQGSRALDNHGVNVLDGDDFTVT